MKSVKYLLIASIFIFLLSGTAAQARLGYRSDQGCLITGEVSDFSFMDQGDKPIYAGYSPKYTEVTIKVLEKESHDNSTSKEFCDGLEINSSIQMTNEAWNSPWKSTIAQALLGNKIKTNVFPDYGFTFFDYLALNPFYYWIIIVLLIILLPTLIWGIIKRKSKTLTIILIIALSLLVIYVITLLLILF